MNIDKARREAARQILDTFQSHGVEIKKQALQEKISHIKGTSLATFTKNISKYVSINPKTQSVPTSIEFFQHQILLGAKSGEILVYNTENLQQTQHIDAAPQLRGPHSQRKHDFAKMKKRVNLPISLSHSGAVLDISAGLRTFISIGKDCIGNVRDANFNSLFTFCCDAQISSVCASEENIVIADGVKIRVFAAKEGAELFTLFGPTEVINSVRAVPRTNSVIAASEDGSLRYFSLIEQSQLIYDAKSPLYDCGALNANLFVCCGPKGVFLFSNEKKNAICQIETTGCYKIACFEGISCFAVGGKGFIKLMQVIGDDIIEIDQFDVIGHVNGMSMEIVKDELYLTACGGREQPKDRLDVGNEKSFLALWKLGSVEIKKLGRFQ
ncbi:U3 small nucleolar RNA interacting protein [Spironucleus salmonicida]|uniref:U3 small nucleolar RNA interacting protein n=1 Tax=Spironucleus salmonicida TaxID=348837 RepID=V6LH89_9EUKA|nr:U3 small nucleolar RNA interacting protein [Spironucleus salmonicida]|eukprot:EST43907.1 U3 small nucleolar RNA interacting protein [Spironucleus salmonicida]